MKVIVAGGRDFIDYEKLKNSIFTRLRAFGQDKEAPTIISGTARGADQLGEKFAAEFNCGLKRMPADWNRHGKAAGYLRNVEMAKEADMLIAFWDGCSKGTGHMIDIAWKQNLEVHIVLYQN